MATLSIPNHAEVARGTLRSLIAKAGLTVEQFLEAAALPDMHFLEKPMSVTIGKGAAKHLIRVSPQLKFFGRSEEHTSELQSR